MSVACKFPCEFGGYYMGEYKRETLGVTSGWSVESWITGLSYQAGWQWIFQELGRTYGWPGRWIEDGREILEGEYKRERTGILPVAWILWPLVPSRDPRTGKLELWKLSGSIPAQTCLNEVAWLPSCQFLDGKRLYQFTAFTEGFVCSPGDSQKSLSTVECHCNRFCVSGSLHRKAADFLCFDFFTCRMESKYYLPYTIFMSLEGAKFMWATWEWMAHGRIKDFLELGR